MLRPVRCVFSAFLLATLGACAVHDAEPVFRGAVFVGDRGISIPLPPPSLHDAPKQSADVEGEVVGLDGAAKNLIVRIVDEVGGAELEVPLTDVSTFHGHGLELDLTDNCIELWLEDDEGNQSERQRVHAVIDGAGEMISVVEGCD